MVLLGVGVALVLLAIGLATADGLLVARHRARNAADAGALAGALRAVEGTAVACAAADRLVTENGGRLASCAVAGLDVTVAAEVRSSAGIPVRAEARAGPVSAA
jgi:secretion/DNA translocation related TadE-like protein